MTTLGVSSLAFILQYVLSVRTFALTVQIVGTVVAAYLIVALLSYVWDVIAAPATRDEQLRLETEGLRRQPNPELEIRFDETAAGFVDTYTCLWVGEMKDCKLYRVAVRHRSKSTMAELKAEQVTTATPLRTYPPLSLRITGCHDLEKQTRMHSGTWVFWDVVEKPDAAGMWVRLIHTHKTVPPILQEIGRSSFRITASCDEGFPVTKLVTLGRKENGDLDFQLSDP